MKNEGVGMSQDFMDAELFADFIIEAKEHLETIEPNLLELEKAPDNLGLLNEIFRPMHSLKGASGFLGLNRINQLAHKAENILDELRKGSMVVTSEIMDVILSSTDALRQMIDNLESDNTEGEVEIDHIKAQIDAIMAEASGQGGPKAAAPQTATPPTPAPAPQEVQVETIAATPVTPQPQEADTPPSASVATPNASPDTSTGTAAKGSDGKRSSLSPKEWIATQPNLPSYALTAFGEGHLKDFIDESFEIIEMLNSGLLRLEEITDGEEDLVNDLFRYFHNLKGNSGIIGFQELNSLTHEAETLLNNIRRGEALVSHELIDLLLFVADVMESLVQRIDPISGKVDPIDTSLVLVQLQQAVAGGVICLPAGLEAPDEESADEQVESVPEEPAAQAPVAPVEVVTPIIFAAATDGDDMDIFSVTVRQQIEIIRAAMGTLQKDNNHKDSIDALHRCLIAIKNSCSFVNYEELKVYAERTAGIVDTARSSDMDFGMMLDLLGQEVEILTDMLMSKIAAVSAASTTDSAPEVIDAPEVADAPESPATAGLAPAAGAAPAPKVVDAPAAVAPASADAAKSASTDSPEASSAPISTPPADNAVKVAPPSRPEPPVLEGLTRAPRGEAAESDPAVSLIKVNPTPSGPAAAPATTAALSTAADGKAPAANAAAVPAKAAANAPAKVPAANTPAKTAASNTPAKPSTPAAPAAAAAGGDAHKGSSTIRVDHEKLDHLMNLIGELIINRNRYTLIARSLEEGGQEVNVAEVAQSLSETTYAMARISDDLQDTIMKVRMVPVASVFSRFPRLVRDLSRKSGKEVDLILEGEETELDKSVVEVIGDPLVHLIRNAVDHGVESEADRVARGKNPKGRVVLRAYHRGNSVAIEIEDDGKGIDPEKMREVAVRKGVISQDEARQLDDREAMELIFAPGFSSAETITDISGRGVGMDVVRTNIKNLKGSVSISSEVGKGTRFTLSLPLTLAIIDALMVNVAEQMYAIPLDAVSETTKIEAVRLTDVKGRKAVTLRGEVIGIVEMAELLCLPRKPLPEMLSVVVIHDNERRLGIVVDRLLERQEIVIKPLGAYLGDLRGISGATIMGDGSVILILDPHEIYMLATSKGTEKN